MKPNHILAAAALFFCSLAFNAVSAQNNPNGRSRNDSGSTGQSHQRKSNGSRSADSMRKNKSRPNNSGRGHMSNDSSGRNGSSHKKMNNGNK
jgi:hypothetical protein